MNSSYTTLPLMDASRNDDLFANKAFDYDYEGTLYLLFKKIITPFTGV